MEHPLKLESDPVDLDQVGCASNASGTAVLVNISPSLEAGFIGCDRVLTPAIVAGIHSGANLTL